MKHLKSFSQLNEGLNEPNLKKSFESNLKLLDDLSKAIIGGKDLYKIAQKEKPELAKGIKQLFDLASKSQKMVKSIKAKGLSGNQKKAAKQVKALEEFAGSLKTGFNQLKTFKKKTEGVENEGLADVVTNTLGNIITGKWIVNLIKNIKSNMTDSYTDFETIQDVFDIKDY